MKILSLTLYQPEDVLEARLPGGVGSLIGFVESFEERLFQEEFERVSGDDRAMVLAVHSSGLAMGWATSRKGDLLLAEQAYLDDALLASAPPPVSGGVAVLAVHYAATEAAEDWTPIPGPWTDMVGSTTEPVGVETMVLRCFGYYEAIRRVLIREWDPIGVGDIDEARDEYDSYAPDVLRLLNRRAPESEIFEYLWFVETEHMGLAGNREHTMAIAQRLMNIARETPTD